jgi:hypothetical protein
VRANHPETLGDTTTVRNDLPPPTQTVWILGARGVLLDSVLCPGKWSDQELARAIDKLYPPGPERVVYPEAHALAMKEVP